MKTYLDPFRVGAYTFHSKHFIHRAAQIIFSSFFLFFVNVNLFTVHILSCYGLRQLFCGDTKGLWCGSSIGRIFRHSKKYFRKNMERTIKEKKISLSIAKNNICYDFIGKKANGKKNFVFLFFSFKLIIIKSEFNHFIHLNCNKRTQIISFNFTLRRVMYTRSENSKRTKK